MIINQTYSGGGIELSIVISVASGSVVTAVKGGKSVTGMAVDGVCVLVVPEAGTWTVSATKDGATSTSRTITVVDSYTATLLYGAKIGTLPVGSSVYAKVGGVRTEFLVVHQGNPDSSFYHESCTGTWLLAKDLSGEGGWGGYRTSYYEDRRYNADNNVMRKYFEETWLPTLEENVRNLLQDAHISFAGKDEPTSALAVTPYADYFSQKVFPLTATEIGFAADGTTLLKDGACLTYFADATNEKRIASLNGTVYGWWTRSPFKKSTGYCYRIKEDGTKEECIQDVFTNGDGSSWGYRPAFILPPDTYVDGDHNIVVVE